MWFKVCKKCAVDKSYADFYKTTTGRPRDVCKECDKARRTRQGFAAKQQTTPANRRRIIAAANGVCQLCQQPAELFLDHCHVTMKIRKAICRTCNCRVGILESRRYRGSFNRDPYDRYIAECKQ